MCYILICLFMQKYTYICWMNTDPMIKTQEDFFNKIFTSHFIARVWKGLLRVFVWEGAGDRTETAIFWAQTYGRHRCLSRSLMLNRRQWGPLCWVLAFFTASYQQLLWSPNSIGVPEGPLGWVWLYLPHLVYLRPISNSTHLAGTPTVCNSTGHSNSVLTELYNSSTPTWSPTRSLKSYVWSSSSGNNCHAVQRSISSGA